MSQQLMQAGRNIVERFGGFNVGCAALGCLLPFSCAILFACSAFFWVAPSIQQFTGATPPEQRRLVQVAPVASSPRTERNGVVVQTQPTPVYPKATAAPFVSADAPAQFSTPLQPYVKYEGSGRWDRQSYLGRANLTGERRTPYSRGQVITFPDGQRMTVVTGDFDFTLLQDAYGAQWYCGPSVNTLFDLSSCQFWR